MGRLEIWVRTLLHRPVPQPVAREIPDRRVKQARRVARRVEALPRPPEPEEPLLHHFPSVITRAQQTRGVTDQAGDLSVEQLPERVHLVCGDSGGQRRWTAFT